jgi:hypothetical protein
MKMKQLAVAAALAMLGTSAAYAVTPGADSPTAEGQKGTEQHDQSATPAAKDQPASSPSLSTTEEKKDDSSSAGASSAPASGGGSFTHGESARCASMTGADKDQCDREEATKTQSPAAQEPAKDASQGSSK